MLNDRIIDHFKNPRNVGELAPPALCVEVENPACGDLLRLSARFEGERLAEARYKTRGCTASIAAGSVLTEMIRGMTAVELAGFTAEAIDGGLGGLEPESHHAAVLCADAVKALLKKRRRY